MATFATPHDWQIGQIILNSYEVESTLGEGGMGQVYHITASSRVGAFETGLGMAVKRPLPTIFTRTRGKEDFEREAETWVKLGKHQHIVQCYFVRTLAGVPCIFIEYMAGGSLKDWIVGEEHALYREGPTGALARILDLAIQMAWGLDYAHKQGLVHQDVKPANVLLTPEGIAKIADFGLAQARFLAGETSRSTRPGASVVVPGVGMMTKEYASPEQAEGKPLTHHTDLWSWAVSVLDMFVGDVDRGHGSASAEILENYLREGPTDPALPRMPSGVATLLRQCFQPDPAARPASMREVAATLQVCYAEMVGAPYPRPEPQSADTSAHDLYGRARSLTEIGKLKEALDVCEQLLLLEPREARNWTLKGHTLSGLQRYEEALAALEQALRLNPQHAETWSIKGNTLHCLKQIQEALEAYEQALRLNPQDAITWIGKGDVLSDLQRYEEVLTALEQALRLYKRSLPSFMKEVDYSGEAEVLVRMGMVYGKRGQLEQALRCFEQALPLYREKGNHAREAETLTNMGALCRRLGQPEEALRLYEQALSLQQEMGDRAGEAVILNNMGLVYRNLGQLEQALRLYEQALSLRREVGDRRGEATTLNNIAAIHHLSLDQPAEALRCFEQALPLWREVGDRAQEAITLSKIGEAYRALGQLEQALRCFEQELRTTQEIKDRAGETDALNKIGSIYQLRGQFDAASRYFKQAIDRNVASEPHHVRLTRFWGGLERGS